MVWVVYVWRIFPKAQQRTKPEETLSLGQVGTESLQSEAELTGGSESKPRGGNWPSDSREHGEGGRRTDEIVQ